MHCGDLLGFESEQARALAPVREPSHGTSCMSVGRDAIRFYQSCHIKFDGEGAGKATTGAMAE